MFEENKDIIRWRTLAKPLKELSNECQMENEETKMIPLEQPDCSQVTEDEIDAALEGSFPASDPLPWTLGTVPCPDPENETPALLESEEQ